MKAKIEIDLSEVLVDEEAISQIIRHELLNEIRIGVKSIIKKDKRFSSLLSEVSEMFFKTLKIVGNNEKEANHD